MPTSRKVQRDLLDVIPPLKASGKIYELGSGWGTLTYSLAKKFPNIEVVGYEISPVPYLFSKVIAKSCAINNLKLEKKNFLNTSLDEAQLIVCYLYPKGMEQLKVELEKKLSPGTWVISNTFAITGWSPYFVHHVQDLYRTKIYIYKF